MAQSYSPATLDLGLGGAGDLLSNEVKQTEEERKKKLLKLGSDSGQIGPNSMGLAAMQLLGNYGS